MPLRDPIAAPAEEEIQLDRLSLHIGTVVFYEDGHLRGKADAVLANPPAEFAQAELLNLFRILARSGTIDGKRSRLYCRLAGNARNRDTASRHSTVSL